MEQKPNSRIDSAVDQMLVSWLLIVLAGCAATYINSLVGGSPENVTDIWRLGGYACFLTFILTWGEVAADNLRQ